jgi:hypothetical protein
MVIGTRIKYPDTVIKRKVVACDEIERASLASNTSSMLLQWRRSKKGECANICTKVIGQQTFEE